MTQKAVITQIAAKKIPQLRGWPLIGNAPQLQKDAIGTIDQAWKDLGDVFQLMIGPNASVVVSHPKLAEDILIEGKHLFQRPKTFDGGTLLTLFLGDSVLTVDGDSWLMKRRLMQPIFHRQRIVTMGDKMTSAMSNMIERWQKLPQDQVLNLPEEMKLVTLDIINRTMFNVNVLPEVDKIGHVVDVGVHFMNRYAQSPVRLPLSWPLPSHNKFHDAKATMNNFLDKVISERRAKRQAHPDIHTGDLLDMLLEARDEETGMGMSDEQVRSEVATIYAAGHETTALALTWTWYALMQHPDKLKRLQDEVDSVLQGHTPTMADLPRLPYTLATLEESLRLYPPVPITVRMANEDAEVGGYTVKKNTLVVIAVNNIHRHPNFWPRPESFEPERFLPENKALLNRHAYMPFLVGPHLCIGVNFALMEGQLLLAGMAQKYTMTLEPGQTIFKEQAVTMRPKFGMYVRLEARA